MLKDKAKYKYRVYVSTLGILLCNSEDEVWGFIGKGTFGSLYEVRNPKDNSFYPEFIPF